jgi:exodeoxyribonuclease VII large subunit
LRERLSILESRLVRSQQSRIHHDSIQLQGLTRQLNTLSPLAVLNRGYALVFDETGSLVKKASSLLPNQRLVTRLAEGSVESRVTEILPERTS